MAFTIVQAGTNLYGVNTDGALSSPLTLPTGITLASSRIPRFARFKNYVVVVNTPSRPLSIGPDGDIRVLTPAPPGSAMVLSNSNGGALSGTFTAKQTFVILDALGNVISESDYGPLSNTTTIVTDYLTASNVQISPDEISARRIYRTATNGAVYFKWIDVSGNVSTVVSDDAPDATIGLVASPSLGTAPDLVLIAEYGGRLWGVGRNDGDNLRYTEAGVMYAWSALNTLPIPHVGDDRFGITALAPRRDTLGVGRRNNLTQVVGNQTANIRPINVSENLGILSQESVVTYRDTVFFLWRDGVYKWDANGIECVSDKAGVRSWFATGDYFNQSMFSQAFAVFDPVNTAYRLFLCTAGQTTPDCWVEYNLKTGKFYGPHKTAALDLSCAFMVRGSNDQPYPMIGSREGYLVQDVETRSDVGGVPIAMRVEMCGHDAAVPDHDKYFGTVSIHTEKESKGELTVTTSVGALDEEVENEPTTHDLTQGRERLDRIGAGKHAGLVFENNELNQPVTIYGYEIDPINDLGRR